ncbi:MAG: heavy metal translocating P-type ATPase [Akkermansia sp.]|nr:heavy metal translocating P-type ATPase [Akkermansia sp.]
MSCSACSARVEREVGRIAGVQSVQVSLLAGRMVVCYRPGQVSADAIAATVCKLGYGAKAIREDEETPREHGAGGLKKRWAWSAALLLPLMVLHHVGESALMTILQLLVLLPILYINRVIFWRGLGALLKKAPNMDTLVALGACAAVADGLGNMILQHCGVCYFESAGMILTLITFGKWLEARATGKTSAAVEQLSALLPSTATVQRGETTERIPADAVERGDIVIIAPGEAVPVDGLVLNGASAVVESALTGESMPVSKKEGDAVYAATTNGNGLLRVTCTKTRNESAMADIIRLVGDAAATKAPISRMADKVSGIFVPIVMVLALLTILAWLLAGSGAAFAISCGIAVLVISCPCALGLATPVAIMAGVGKGAKAGILYRNGEALEQAHSISHLVLDKTGTLTLGAPKVCDVIPTRGVSREELLQVAAALENGSTHPLAAAILAAAPQTPTIAPEECSYLPGRGLVARLVGKICLCGNARLMQGHNVEHDIPLLNRLAAEGKTPLCVVRDGQLLGTIAVSDPLRPDAASAVQRLQQMGIHLMMLTGDNAHTAAAVATRLGINDYRAECLPADKEQTLAKLQATGTRAGMVGDGINDAPALMRADVGFSLGSGTDIAHESADIILAHNRLEDVAHAVGLSRAVMRNIRQNLFWAFAYNILAIPLAAGVFYPLCGWLLHPGVAAAAMGMSSLCVVSNALRLQRYSFSHPQHTPNTMNQTITLTVNGMMCPHCEQHVTKALLALEGVLSCTASHLDNSVTLTLGAPAPDLSSIKSTITEAGYEVV